MPKICYLHVGLHKTASSSFQRTCAENIDLLQENGVTYPLFSCSAANKPKIENHSIPIVSLLTEKPENYHINKRWRVSSEINEVNSSYDIQLENCLTSSNNVIISGEGISLLSEQSLSKLINKIQRNNYEIRAFALIRSPYSMICSAIQEIIKNGKYFELISLNNCVPTSSSTALIGRSNIVKKLKSVFGSGISFHSFEYACTHSYGPVGFLLKELLSQDPSAFEYQKTNESLSNLSVRIQNEFNAINPAFVGNKFNTQFRRLSPRVNKRLEFSGKFLLTEDEYALIEKFVKIETENLNKITGLDFSTQSLKFSKPIY